VFLLEKHFFGEEYRVLITKAGYFAAVHRTPASVRGDGKHSIKQLTEAENFRRMNPRTTCLCEVKLDEVVTTFLAKNQHTLQSVPAQGAVVQLRPNTNVSKGGGCEDITDRAHPSIKKLACRVLDAVGGLAYVGLDLICQDISKPITKQEWIICELNAYPGLSLHTVPGKGQSHDVAKPLVEASFNL
jgi:cyanophycin synthetase